MRIGVLLLFLIFLALTTNGEAGPVPESKMPSELKLLVVPGNRLLDFASADLNGDDLRDYVFVTEEQKKGKGSTDGEDERQRALFIALPAKDGTLRMPGQRRDHSGSGPWTGTPVSFMLPVR